MNEDHDLPSSVSNLGVGAKVLLLGIVTAILVAIPAIAQEWQQFGSKRFGFVFDIPPSYELSERYEDGGGAMFLNPDGDLIVVWGIDMQRGDFLPHIREWIERDRGEGWDVTYERVTSGWAAYSGVREGMIRYVKGITVCEGRAAFFLLDYPLENKREYDPIVVRMEKTLRREGCR